MLTLRYRFLNVDGIDPLQGGHLFTCLISIGVGAGLSRVLGYILVTI